MAMEKSAKSKNTLLKFLPKAASAVTFQDKRLENAQKLKSHIGKGFSAPMTISIIPPEARQRSKNSGSFISHEPTSPKVSCIGQIKQKHKLKNKNKNQTPKPKKAESKKKKQSIIGNFFAKPGRKSDVSANRTEIFKDRGPCLGQIKRFASSRDRFANFDWTAQIAPVDIDQNDEFSDEEEVNIPYSAPIFINGGIALEPRKEVNLWKRRTMAQPPPLQLNPMVVSH